MPPSIIPCHPTSYRPIFMLFGVTDLSSAHPSHPAVRHPTDLSPPSYRRSFSHPTNPGSAILPTYRHAILPTDLSSAILPTDLHAILRHRPTFSHPPDRPSCHPASYRSIFMPSCVMPNPCAILLTDLSSHHPFDRPSRRAATLPTYLTAALSNALLKRSLCRTLFRNGR